MVFVFLLFMNASVFGQTVSEEKVDENNLIVNNTAELNSNKQENVSTTTNLNFVLWFMGSKQDPNTTIQSEGTNTKKKVMTSGIAPNRLLIKAFLKKAADFETALV